MDTTSFLRRRIDYLIPHYLCTSFRDWMKIHPLDLHGKEARRSHLVSFLEDPNTKISENVLELFTINKYSEALSLQLNKGPVELEPPFIQPKMGLRELTQHFDEKSVHFLLSFMHYYG